MYYEEMIKGGQTYWRGTPNGKWKPKSNQQFTNQVANLKKKIAHLEQQIEDERCCDGECELCA